MAQPWTITIREGRDPAITTPRFVIPDVFARLPFTLPTAGRNRKSLAVISLQP